MASVNEVRIIGNLGRDPEIKRMQDGTPVANFSVATTESWKDKNGEWQEKTEWHRCAAWRWVAEKVEKSFAKGKQVYVEGRLETRQWDKDGQTHYTTEIIAQKVMVLGRKEEGGKPAGVGDSGHFEPPPMTPKETPDELEDLPF